MQKCNYSLFCLTVRNLTVACSGAVYVWVDGELQSWGNLAEPDTITLPKGRHLLAISCTNIYVKAGILWSTTTGQESDKTSRCTTDHQIGWSEKKFTRGRTWGAAETFGINGNSPIYSLNITEISPSAHWLWMGPNFRSNDNNHPFTTVYCRKFIK